MKKTTRRRRSLRLPSYDYASPGAYHVTICARNREPVFGAIDDDCFVGNEFGAVAEREWRLLPERYQHVRLDEWVLMPNHLHGIVVLTDDEWPVSDRTGRGRSRTTPTTDGTSRANASRKPLGRIIGAFKTVSTKKINRLRDTAGVSIWQRGYYEHIIRSDASLSAIREYIRSNPAAWSEDAENPRNRRNTTSDQ